MNEDNIEFQRGGVPSVPENAPDEPGAAVPAGLDKNDADKDAELGDPKVFDFSSDLKISVVKDEPKPAGSPAKPPSEHGPIRTGPINKLEEPVPPSNLPGAVFGESKEWPFATPETLARHASPVPKGSAPAPQVRTMETAARDAADKSGNILPRSPFAAAAPKQAPQPRTEQTMPRAARPQSTPNAAATVAPAAPAPAPAPAPAQSAVPAPSDVPTDDANIKNLRTYEGDIAEALAHRGVSRTSIAIAESKKRGEGETLKSSEPAPAAAAVVPMAAASGSDEPSPRPSSKPLSKLIFVLISIILAGGGAIVGYMLYSRSPLATSTGPVAPTERTVPALIPADMQAVITVDGLTSANIVAKVKAEMAKPQTPGTVKEIIPLEKRDGEDYRVSAPEMAAMIDVPIPDIIARTLAPQWMLGSYADQAGIHPFVVVTTNLFQNAFAGMLTWEPTLPGDLTSFISPADAARAAWKDAIIRNKDVRAFVTQEGKTLFLYSFIDNETLVVAEDEATLSAAVTRVENKAFVR